MSEKDKVRPEYIAPSAHTKSAAWPTKRISREEATVRFGEPKNSIDELIADLQIIGGEELDARVRAELAAAEERGRRRGVEEAALVADRNADTYGAGIGMIANRGTAKEIRALAPRDSAPCPEGDPLCGCQKSMDAPPDSGKGEP